MAKLYDLYLTSSNKAPWGRTNCYIKSAQTLSDARSKAVAYLKNNGLLSKYIHIFEVNPGHVGKYGHVHINPYGEGVWISDTQAWLISRKGTLYHKQK